MRTFSPRLAAGAALLLAACRPGFDAGPDLGSLARVETVPIELASETRPALAGAEEGRGSVGVALAEGSLVLAFGWKAADGDDGAATTVRASFASGDGSVHVLAQTPVPPPGADSEGWLQGIFQVPDELVGRRGALVFENTGAGGGRALFTARPELVPADRPGAARPNVVLISLDTLRADRLGCYGHSRPTSPTIDALAREGTLFRNAFAQAAWTLPSHYTMMTALYPSAHGVHPDRFAFFGNRHAHESLPLRGSGRERTLAERFADLGYFTAAITESGWVDARFGFDQGFASYLGHSDDHLVDGTQALTLRWLRTHHELPFFLFLHTYQTHQPYHQPPPYDTMFVDPGHVGYALPGAAVPMDLLARFRAGVFPAMPADQEAFRGLYDGEVRYVDDFIAALLAALREHALERDTILLITADHGEELFEHGDFDHGNTLYDEVMRVPFIVWGPGRIPAGQVVDAPVATLDVLPTLVELAGGEVEDGLQGRSLVPLLTDGGGSGERVLFAEGYATVSHMLADREGSVPLTAVWQGTDKVIFYGDDLERAELFDLAGDPGETRDLAAGFPDKVTRLRELVRAWREENGRIHEQIGEATVGIDAEMQERLRALGYL